MLDKPPIFLSDGFMREIRIRCSVLTKGILPHELAQMSPDNEYGITLVSLDEKFRADIEPFFAPYQERINALRYLCNMGCKTWTSIEPYPTPNIIQQDLNDILCAVSFTDKLYSQNKLQFKSILIQRT